MRRSWFVGIVVPALLAIGFSSGCATNQKRLASTPAPQFEEVQPVESGRRLFGWGWWSKPKASTSPMMADQSFVSESPVLAPESHTETATVDPWPSHKSDRLSKFFPSFNRKSTTPQPGPTPVLGEPTASRDAKPFDRGVRQAGAAPDETSDPKSVTPARRPSDDPPLISSPIRVPGPDNDRPDSASKDSVDLGVAGANESINQSAKVDFQVKDRRYSDPVADLNADLDQLAGRAAPATLLNSPEGSKDKLKAEPEQPINVATNVKDLPTPSLPATAPPTAPSRSAEAVVSASPNEWPKGLVSASTGFQKPKVEAPKDEPKSPKPVERATIAELEEALKPAVAATVASGAPKSESKDEAKAEPVAAASTAPKSPEVTRTADVNVAQTEPAKTGSANTPQLPNPSVGPSTPTNPPASTSAPRFEPTPTSLTAQAFAAPQGPVASPQSVGTNHTHNDHVWGLGLFSGKLIPCLKKKFHKDYEPVQVTVRPSPQSFFPQSYFECEYKAPVTPTAQAPAPTPQITRPTPTPQVVLPSAQGVPHAAKKKCQWLEDCKVLKAIKEWKAKCKIKMCPCCSGGHKSDLCVTGTGLASPQGSPQYSSPQAKADTNASATDSARPEAGDLSKRRDIVQRVSAEGVDESPKR